jgi:hypothetical protein
MSLDMESPKQFFQRPVVQIVIGLYALYSVIACCSVRDPVPS